MSFLIRLADTFLKLLRVSYEPEADSQESNIEKLFLIDAVEKLFFGGC